MSSYLLHVPKQPNRDIPKTNSWTCPAQHSLQTLEEEAPVIILSDQNSLKASSSRTICLQVGKNVELGNALCYCSAHCRAISILNMTPIILKEDNFILCYQRRLGIQWSNQPHLQGNSAFPAFPDYSKLLAQYSIGGIWIVKSILLIYLFHD